MGGRGSEFKTSDRWAWVQELSEHRLEQYGRMTHHKLVQGYSALDTLTKGAFNYELSKEFERRNGYKPSWETKTL